MKFYTPTNLSKVEKEGLLKLWNKEYPKTICYASMNDFNQYLENLEQVNHFILADQEGNYTAWYFDFLREDERWFALLIDSTIQRKGLGTKILGEAKKRVDELNAWVIDHNRAKKINGEYYLSPLPFYEKNGFEILHKQRLELDSISAVKIRWIKF